MECRFKLPALSIDRKGLYIAGEYVLKSERCECGRDWSDIIFWPSRGWMNTCRHCAYLAADIYNDVEILSRDEVMAVALSREKLVRKPAEQRVINKRSLFWLQEVIPWMAQQGRPVTYREVAQQFNRKKENVLHFMRKLTDDGLLEYVAFDKRSRGYLVKEN